MRIDDKNAQAWGNLGIALMHQNKLKEAIEALRRAIEINPKIAKFHYSLGNALKNTNQKL